MHSFNVSFHFAQRGREKDRGIPIPLLGSIQYLNPINTNLRMFRYDKVKWLRPDQIQCGQCLSARGDMESLIFE